MSPKPLITYRLAEVHGNRTHLTAFGRYTGFEVESIENVKTRIRQGSSQFLYWCGFSHLLPFLVGSWGEQKGQCNQECNQKPCVRLQGVDFQKIGGRIIRTDLTDHPGIFRDPWAIDGRNGRSGRGRMVFGR